MTKDSVIPVYLKGADITITALIFLFLPLYQKVVIYLLTALLLVVVYQNIRLGFRKISFRHMPWGILFLVYVLGLTYTSNMDFGWKEIESRFAFVLLPILFGLSHTDYRKYFKYLIWGLVLGCIISSGICYYFALECFKAEGARFCFEASHLSHYMHPTYLSLYYIVASTFLVLNAFEKGNKWWYKVLTIGLAIYLGYFIYGFYSIGPWIATFAMLSLIFFAAFYFRKKLLVFFGVFAGMILLAVTMTAKLELLRSDYDTISTEVALYMEDEKAYISENLNNTQSIKARIVLWNAGYNFIKDHPFGAGTGDVRDDLMDHYTENGMITFAEEKLNPHNQFLQTGVSVGILGILSLIFAFGYYLWLGFKESNYYLISIITLFGVACLFESVLERQYGILLLMTFLGILIREKDVSL